VSYRCFIFLDVRCSIHPLCLLSSLKRLPPGVFRSLSSLEMLVLDTNLLSSLSSSALQGLSQLQVCPLSSC